MQAVYDGSLEGFLTLVHEVYYKKLSLLSIQKELPSGLFSDELFLVKTEEQKAIAVLEALKKRFTKNNFETILVIFMCDTKAFELALLEFIVLGVCRSPKVESL